MTRPSEQPDGHEASLAKKRSRLGVIDVLEHSGGDDRLPVLRLLAEVDLDLTLPEPDRRPGFGSGPGESADPLDEQLDLMLSRV